MSISEAKRLIKAGAVRLDGVKVLDPNYDLPYKREGYVLQVGRRFWKVVPKRGNV